jgi:peptidase E
MGGHDFDHRRGNQALCDRLLELTNSDHPRICLLPTAGGDPADQILRFKRCFGKRDCEPTSITLFRLAERPVELRDHLMSQDAIYVSGGSLVNLLAIWRAHGIDEILREAWEEGILLCGQSAGAMCWFEAGITSSSGAPMPVEAMGMLRDSASVHYHRDPERKAALVNAIEEGELSAGLGLDDQTGVLFEGEEMTGAVSSRLEAGVWRVAANGDGRVHEERVKTERIADTDAAIGEVSLEIIELRQTVAIRASSRQRRRVGSGPGRL